MKNMAMMALVLSAALPWQAEGQTKASPRGAYVLPGDTIIPRIDTGQAGTAADGTPLGTFMTFQFMNTGATTANILLSFHDTSGNPLNLRFEICKNTLASGESGSCFSPLGDNGLPTDQNAISQGTFIADTLQPGGSSFARTFINGPRQVGYATLLSQPARSVAVSANFNQQAARSDGSLRPLFSASVPLSTSVQKKFFVPALNAGTTATLAIVSVAGGSVNFRALGSGGTQLCTASRNTTVGESLAFLIGAPNFLPCAAGRETLIEVTGQALSGVGFTFLGEAFSTQPVYGPAPAP